jgi:hypothetical protein
MEFFLLSVCFCIVFLERSVRLCGRAVVANETDAGEPSTNTTRVEIVFFSACRINIVNYKSSLLLYVIKLSTVVWGIPSSKA